MRTKHPTYTSQVLEVMSAADDFMTSYQIENLLRIGHKRVSAALHHLFQYHVVDAMACNGKLLWYATPDEDQRQHTHRTTVEGTTRNRKPAPHPRRKASQLPTRK